MRAVTWQGPRRVAVQDVPDPTIEQPDDAIIRITSSGLCGSDLHLYEVLGPFIDEGDVLGHEPMGIVEEVGDGVTAVAPGDRVVIPFQVCCGACWMCDQGLHTQCERTQVRDQGMGAALFGYTKLYGQVPGAQAEYLRVPHANFMPTRVPHEPPDERFVYLSDVLPTAWQAYRYADVPPGGTLVVIGLGPIGEMATRIARHHGTEVVGIDQVAERNERVRSLGVTTIDLGAVEDVTEAVRSLTNGRGADAVIDAVGMEADPSPAGKLAQRVGALLPDAVAAPFMEHAGVDRLAGLYLAIDVVRRGGTVSLSGVYGGMADPLPMLTLFDKQVQLRMGQANVKRWMDELLPLVVDDDVLGLESFHSHRLPLEAAPDAYEMFQRKDDGAFKVLFDPQRRS